MPKDRGLCAVVGCGKPARALTWCSAHYQTWRRHGDATVVKQKQMHGMTVEERFWHYTKKGPGCWKWVGSRDKRGYGRIDVVGMSPYLAHRLSYIIRYGHFPEHLKVLHKCDNPQCVNPEHLFLGTQADNVADMHEKGRALKRGLKGTQHSQAKLNEQQVREIRAASGFAKDIAAAYGISPTQVYDIRHRRSWAHITDT